MPGTFQALLTADLLSFFLVFCRLGAAMMVLPGFGDTFVAPRLRLALALALTLVVTPVVGTTLPMLGDEAPVVALLVMEIGVGLFLGITVRLLMAALQVAGTIIGFQISLANALVADVASAQQGALPSSLLSTLGLVLVFVTDLHHVMLAGLVDSYRVLPPGGLPPIGDFTETVARLVADSFRIGLQLAVPFILVGILTSVGMGLLTRLMPQAQIFFVAMPLQIMLGLLVFGLTLSVGMGWFMSVFEDRLSHMFLAG
jgi:flagellar biosynthesis protein FliR